MLGLNRHQRAIISHCLTNKEINTPKIAPALNWLLTLACWMKWLEMQCFFCYSEHKIGESCVFWWILYVRMCIMSVCLHSFSRMVGAIFLWYSYLFTLTFNGGRGSLAICCLKKLILSLSKCSLDTRLVWLVMDLHTLIMCIHVSIEHISKTTMVWGLI